MRKLMNEEPLLGQRVPLSLRVRVIRRLALKLCLRKAAWRSILLGAEALALSRVRDPGNPQSSACECFRGAGSELGELSGRPRGKSRQATLAKATLGSEC